jgi:hypothetical protein
MGLEINEKETKFMVITNKEARRKIWVRTS